MTEEAKQAKPKAWHAAAQGASAEPVKVVPPPDSVPPEDDAEMKALVAAARIRMIRGDERITVPIKDVAAHKLEGWVIAAEQG